MHTQIRDYRGVSPRQNRYRPDPVDVALQNAADMSEDELSGVMEGRRASIAAQLASWRQLHDTAAAGSG